MSLPNIVNLDREEDIDAWLADDNNIYVGRSFRFLQVDQKKWGNPAKLNEFNTRQQVVKRYREHILNNKQLLKFVSELSGKVLGCHCAPELCHAEVLPNQVLMPFDKASGYLNLEFHSHHHLAMQAHYTSLRKLCF